MTVDLEEGRADALRDRLLAVSQALGTALTVSDVARVVLSETQSAVGTFFAGVALLSEDGTALRFVTLEGLPAATTAEWGDVALSVPSPLTAAAVERRSFFHNSLAALVADYPATRAAAEETGIQSFGNVPMIVSGDVVGVLSVSWRDPDMAREDARRFLITVAGMCGQAAARALMHEQSRSAAEVLQHAIVPPNTPTLPGVETAARYVAYQPGLSIGGDWWDVFRTRSGKIVVTVGDVAGHGLGATRVMAALRYALRAYAFAGATPAEAMAEANDLLIMTKPTLATATAVVLELDTHSGALAWTRAGHPAPILISAESVRVLDGEPGMLLGAVPGVTFPQQQLTLDQGDVLLAYTDGLIERRSEALDQGQARLVEALRRPIGPLDQLCAELLSATEGDRNPDDICFLALRLRTATVTAS